ncbi:MAG: hypothetical protein ABEJ36_03520 [Candidatus Nanosalina sp.]
MDDKFPERLKENRIGEFVYKKSLLGALAVTRAFEKIEYPVPNHWKAIFDTLSVSSSVAHEQISLLDEEVEQEFEEKEEKITRALGLGDKLYSEEELRKLEERKNEIELPENRPY